MVQLDDLTILLAVARTASITEAAQALGYSQSTVSRRIARLERVYGAQLVSRERSVPRLTPEGEQVAEFARDVNERHTTLIETMQRSLHLTGLIRIATSTTPAAILPGMIANFAAQHPSVQFDVAVADSAEVTQSVLAHRAHLGLCGRRLVHPRLDYRVMAPDEIVLIVADGHGFAVRGQATIADLHGEQFVLREDGSGTQATFFDRLASAGHSPGFVQGSITVHSADALLDAVRAGLGVGIVSRHTLASHPWGLSEIPLPELSLKRTLWVVIDRENHHPRQVMAFADWITQQPDPISSESGSRLGPHTEDRPREPGP